MAKRTLQLGRDAAQPRSPGEAVLDAVPNPQAGTNNWWVEDGYGGGSFGSPAYGGGSGPGRRAG